MPGGDPHGVAGGLDVCPQHRGAPRVGRRLSPWSRCRRVYHEAVALRLAEAGVHALVEKPLATTSPARPASPRPSRAAGLVGGVGHIERYNPAVQSCGRGSRTATLARSTRSPPAGRAPSRRASPTLASSKDLAPHDLDLAAWVARSRYVAVSAQTRHRSGREHEDLVSITGGSPTGSIANHLINWLSPHEGAHHRCHGRARRLCRRHPHGRPHVLRERHGPHEWDSIAGFRGVLEGDVTRFAFPSASRSRASTPRSATRCSDCRAMS